ncbi:MAG: signal recognition particle protein [Gemmatimonadota bacterium]|nr:MAG: signal recognition particle protein [Gemmatimonadota bacterium]
MFEDLSSRLEGVFKSLRGRGVLTEDNVREALREIRRALLEADVHYKVAKDFVKRVEERAVGQEVLKGIHPGQQVVKVVHDEMVQLLGGTVAEPNITGSPPVPVMVVGLQGSGKTTTCAKLANWLKKKGRRPYLVPADPYRPAARDQLIKLAQANGHAVYEGPEEDPVEICRRGMQEAVRAAADVVLLDTAGRLHVDDELMEELRQVRATVKPHEILLVVDGMIGQDSVNVAEQFREKLGFDGVVLTKMDGDARGGAALSIRHVTGVPIKFLGVGESADALEPFHPDRMASRILNMGDVLTLVERAQESVEEGEAEELQKKLRKNEFTLEDFRTQLRRLKKMGPLSQIMGMLPGVPKDALQEVEKDGGKSLTRVEAIISSMTPAERTKPSILDGSRRRRIARGSGTSVQEVNQLLKQFGDMRKMMKQMGRMKKGKGKGRGRFARFPGM